MALERADVHGERILDQLMRRQIFEDAADFGVALLHRDDLFDVLDVAPELIGFLEELGVFREEKFSQLRQIPRQLLSVGVFREIFAEVAIRPVQEGGGLRELGRLGAA